MFNDNFKKELESNFDGLEFSTHETDLYVLYKSEAQKNELIQFIKARKIKFNICLADVPGNSWFGKYFIEIPVVMPVKGLKK